MKIFKRKNKLPKDYMIVKYYEKIKNEIEKEYIKLYLGGRYEEYYRD